MYIYVCFVAKQKRECRFEVLFIRQVCRIAAQCMYEMKQNPFFSYLIIGINKADSFLHASSLETSKIWDGFLIKENHSNDLL